MSKQKIDRNTPELTHALKNAMYYLQIEINDVELHFQSDSDKFTNEFINDSNKKIGQCEMLISMIENYLNQK